MPKKPLYYVLDQAVEKYGDSLAADFMGKTYTYKDIGDTVNRVAKGLQIHGVKKGTKVGLFLPNSPYAIIFYYAILKAGGTVVNFNPLYVERELTHQIEDSETDIMVTLDLKVVYDKMYHMLHATVEADYRLSDAIGFTVSEKFVVPDCEVRRNCQYLQNWW